MRRICVITGTRAEYGLLRTLMTHLKAAEDVDLRVIATGAHLVAAHGNTRSEIEQDGFQIDEAVDMLLAADTPEATGTALGLGVIGLTGALARQSPDLVVLLGDRYEALAAAQAAMMLGIPIAHIHGGETTEGAMDEAIRHAITKMSHLHFAATEEFRQRILQMGEAPQNVHSTGALGLDNIAALDPAPKEELEQVLGLGLDNPIFLVTYHPVTLSQAGTYAIDALLEALNEWPEARIVFTGANADALGQVISSKVAEFCAARPETTANVASLGFRRYLSLMGLAGAVIGNSSSGIIEAPSMGVPTVNIGPRQQGRPRAPSVIDCAGRSDDIRLAISRALDPAHRKIAAQRKTPYGAPGAGSRIADVLRSVDLNGLLMKRFYQHG